MEQKRKLSRIDSVLGIIGYSSIHAKTWAFADSKALLGSLGPVTRARVCDLINTDPDQRPLSPPQRVAGHCFQHSDFFR